MKLNLSMSEGEKIAWEYLATLSQEKLDEISAGIRTEIDRIAERFRPMIETFAKRAAKAEWNIICDALDLDRETGEKKPCS